MSDCTNPFFFPEEVKPEMNSNACDAVILFVSIVPVIPASQTFRLDVCTPMTGFVSWEVLMSPIFQVRTDVQESLETQVTAAACARGGHLKLTPDKADNLMVF